MIEIKSKNNLIDKIKQYFEDSKESLNYKAQLIESLIQSMREENDQLQQKGKNKKYKIYSSSIIRK